MIQKTDHHHSLFDLYKCVFSRQDSLTNLEKKDIQMKRLISNIRQHLAKNEKSKKDHIQHSEILCNYSNDYYQDKRCARTVAER